MNSIGQSTKENRGVKYKINALTCFERTTVFIWCLFNLLCNPDTQRTLATEGLPGTDSLEHARVI